MQAVLDLINGVISPQNILETGNEELENHSTST